MRTENSLKNSTAALIGQAISIAIGFLTRTVFIHVLGDEYLGLNGLFTSVLSLLSLTELGLGTAVSFALYKPIAENNTVKTAMLMNFFRTSYRYVAITTAAFGLLLIPFLRILINDANGKISHIYIIYFIFLLNNVLGYFFTYNKILITANQKHYINTIIESLFMLLQYVLQIIVIVTLRNYIIYLTVQLICIFISNVIIYKKANRMYPFLRAFINERLDKSSLKELRGNIYAMLVHRISGIVVTGTDNILIAQVSVITLGYYTNYTYVVTTIATVFAQVFGAIAASIGNLVATEAKQKQELIYKNLNFIAFWIYGMPAVAIALMIQPFITLWAGETRILPTTVVYIMLINFFLSGMKQPNILIINAAGLFKQIRMKSIFEAAINLVFSLLLLFKFKMGIFGVLLSTTISFMLTNFWWDVFVIYKHNFKKSCMGYFFRYGQYVFILVITYTCTKLIFQIIVIDNWLKFIFAGIISIVIPCFIFLVFTFHMQEFGFIKSLLFLIQKKLYFNLLGKRSV